ncbi:YicC family protein [Myxococcota bacterium]|nr:YicC family protein [Myxococcota bacterium]
MNSMTGYGRGEATNREIAVVVEMKSVNNRFLDVQLRVPREYMLLEPRIVERLKRDLVRGRVEVFVRRTALEGSQQVQPDPALAESYRKAMVAVAQRLQRPAEEVTLSLVLAQPGVLTVTDREADALGEWDVVSAALEAALGELQQMRASEGRALQEDLGRHLDALLRLRAEVAAVADGVAERLKSRLEGRLQRLLADRVDPARLAQEAAVLADKADISEELARLESHVAQFAEALAAAEPVGRKLDFLLQELHREINTIGSKSAEHPVSARVVEMKSVAERMREQAANVE